MQPKMLPVLIERGAFQPIAALEPQVTRLRDRHAAGVGNMCSLAYLDMRCRSECVGLLFSGKRL